MSNDKFGRVLSRLEAVGARRVAWAIGRRHNVTLEELLGDSKTTEACKARRELSSTLHGTLGLNDSEIARMLERDHSSIRLQVARRLAELERGDA